ncbi:hypothetical protein ACHQM5_017212 [Ranunculus cassubicifolius]
MEFRVRDYEAEEAAHLLPRVHTDDHPLITPPSIHKVFYDPLRGSPANSQTHTQGTMTDKEDWPPFRRSLMQNFSLSNNVSISSISDIIIKSGKVIAVTLILQVARLLLDTSVSEFYPTLFVLVIEVMDMLGDMVWERIKRRAEYADDGTLICLLREEFDATEVCADAKETCYNWFCKIGSIRELLPRIYLELAISRCWRFLHEQVSVSLQRLVMMIRGLADPLASFYCRLYMVRCAQKFFPQDTGYLLTCIGDMNMTLASIITEKETVSTYSRGNKKLLISLLEPTVEWIVKCICKDTYKKRQLEDIFTNFQFGKDLSISLGTSQCVSIILHYFLKELPAEIICLRSSYIVQLLESTNDISMNQHLNFRVLGLKLSEQKPQASFIDSVLGKVFQAVTQYNSPDDFVEAVDAFLDIVLQCNMGSYLTTLLDNISIKARGIGIIETTQHRLQAFFIKLLTHFNTLEDVYALNHFAEILHLMHGSSRDVVNMHILSKGTRNGPIHDPTMVQLLLEVSQALHASMDILNINDDHHKEQSRLISRFVQMVDYGAAVERHLTFLAECRGVFGRVSELKQVVVHCSNKLAIQAIKEGNKRVNFVKTCIAFNEVTIPSISDSTKRMHLYVESVEVALLGGLLSHADGLVDSAIDCLRNLDQSEGSLQENDILSLMQKLCSLVVMIPGNPEQGVAYVPRSLLLLAESCWWITPHLRTRVFCAILSLTATLSQKKLPYHVCNTKVVSNDVVYYGDPSYNQDIAAISTCVVTNLINVILQEPHVVTRGRLALEACNCILSSFRATEQICEMCLELIEIAKACLSVKDNYLKTTLRLFKKLSGDEHSPSVSVSV